LTSLPEQSHLPVVVGVRGSRLLDQLIAGSLIGKVPPRDVRVLETEFLVNVRKPRFPADGLLIKALDLGVFDGFEEKMRIERLAGRGHIGSAAYVAPSINHVSVSHDTTSPADETAELLQFLGVEADFGGRPFRPFLSGEHCFDFIGSHSR
jgi:hypothetical protein